MKPTITSWSINRHFFSFTQQSRTGRNPWKELRELLAFEIASGGQVSIVNRLDRETSGLVLVAKTAAAARRFGLLMQQRTCKRISRHRLELAGMGNQTVDAALDRQGKHQQSAIWLKQTIHAAGAPAPTISRRTTLY